MKTLQDFARSPFRRHSCAGGISDLLDSRFYGNDRKNRFLSSHDGVDASRHKALFSGFRLFLVVLLFSLGLFPGCAQQRPVLYPSPHLKTVGQERAEADINDCIRMASEQGAQRDTGDRVAKDTVEGGAVGGAVGAGVGAVFSSVGRGAAAGAAGGAAGALTRGLFRAGEPDPVFRGFVDRCLREKGYEPIGWR